MRLAQSWLAAVAILGMLAASGSDAAPAKRHTPHALAPQAKAYSFALLPFPSSSAQASEGVVSPVQLQAQWQQQLQSLDEEKLAFVVVNGLKANGEPCSDSLFQQRKSFLDEMENGIVLSVAAQDWSECQKGDGSSNAIERLARLRELFFADEFSLGNSKLEVARQSINPKFRNFPENARWQINGVLFATINLPANNNRYRIEAGRNSEFEDRQVANRDWLKKLFAFANLNKHSALVLISDGNLMEEGYARSGALRSAGSERQRDGFADLQQKFLKLAERYNGKILLIDHAANSKAPPTIRWRGKIGLLSLPAQANNARYVIGVNPAKPQIFSIKVK
ncbi:MAG: hypothetical protein HYZ45_07585 [Burkholderiales bacterium]|nr:hypothetical protein [Burkholderiales bacterium]